MSQSTSGIIFNVQRFSIHDGPGIRDLIFLKGCPLHCTWCSNPESQCFLPELDYRINKCIGCHACVASCPVHAIAPQTDGSISIDRTVCQRCFTCTKACCSGALRQIGERITAEALVERVMKQHMSWRAENGITLSGGEALAQREFAIELLRLFRKEGVNTAIETCGYVPYDTLEEAAQYLDLIFFDLKCIESSVHKQYTGVENERILSNLYRLSCQFPKLPLRVRTPLIPGINDSHDHLLKIVTFLKQLPSLQDYELLPYHNFGEGKYQQLGRQYQFHEIKPPDKKIVKKINNDLRRLLGLPEK